MKNAVKTVTLTIEELHNIISESASGNIEAAKNIVVSKIEEKAKRLARQREMRRQRQQQKADAEIITNSADGKHPKASDSTSKTVMLPLNKELAKCILWFNNRRDALKSNMVRIVREIALCGGSASTLASIENAMILLLQITSEAAEAAHNYLHTPKYRLRPTAAIISNFATTAEIGSM